MSYYDMLKNYIESVLFDGASADAPLYAADSRVFFKASPVASRMLKIMWLLSADAAKAGAADMTFDEINAEIVVARSEKWSFCGCWNGQKNLVLQKGELTKRFRRLYL